MKFWINSLITAFGYVVLICLAIILGSSVIFSFCYHSPICG